MKSYLEKIAPNVEVFNTIILLICTQPGLPVDVVIPALEVPFFHQFSTLYGFIRYLDPLNTNVYIAVDFNNIVKI